MADIFDELKELSCDKLIATLCKPTILLKGWKASAETLAQVKIRGVDIKIECSTSRDTVIHLTLSNAKANSLMEVLLPLLNIHQLVEGYFPRIEKVDFIDGSNSIRVLDENDYKKALLYFPTHSEYVRNDLKLCEFHEAVQHISSNFAAFEKLLQDLRIPLNIFYTTLADNHLFPEIRAAFLIELVEPFAEYEGLKNDDRVTLGESLSKFILYCGHDLFKTEISNNIDFIPRMVQTRVNIMHTKRAVSKRKNELGINQVIVYNIKLQILYRVYLLRKLGFAVNLDTAIKYAENPFDPSVGFDLIKSFA